MIRVKPFRSFCQQDDKAPGGGGEAGDGRGRFLKGFTQGNLSKPFPTSTQTTTQHPTQTKDAWNSMEIILSTGCSSCCCVNKPAQGETWEADHLDAFRLAKMGWPPNIEQDADLYAAVQHLTRRMQELAWYFTYSPQYKDLPTPTYHDLNPSIKLRSEAKERVQTLICNSVIWARKLKKVLWGGEALMLQGMPRQLIDEQAALPKTPALQNRVGTNGLTCYVSGV